MRNRCLPTSRLQNVHRCAAATRPPGEREACMPGILIVEHVGLRLGDVIVTRSLGPGASLCKHAIMRPTAETDIRPPLCVSSLSLCFPLGWLAADIVRSLTSVEGAAPLKLIRVRVHRALHLRSARDGHAVLPRNATSCSHHLGVDLRNRPPPSQIWCRQKTGHQSDLLVALWSIAT